MQTNADTEAGRGEGRDLDDLQKRFPPPTQPDGTPYSDEQLVEALRNRDWGPRMRMRAQLEILRRLRQSDPGGEKPGQAQAYLDTADVILTKILCDELDEYDTLNEAVDHARAYIRSAQKFLGPAAPTDEAPERRAELVEIVRDHLPATDGFFGHTWEEYAEGIVDAIYDHLRLPPVEEGERGAKEWTVVAPGVTQEPVEPDGRFVYRVRFPDARQEGGERGDLQPLVDAVLDGIHGVPDAAGAEKAESAFNEILRRLEAPEARQREGDERGVPERVHWCDGRLRPGVSSLCSLHEGTRTRSENYVRLDVVDDAVARLRSTPQGESDVD